MTGVFPTAFSAIFAAADRIVGIEPDDFAFEREFQIAGIADRLTDIGIRTQALVAALKGPEAELEPGIAAGRKRIEELAEKGSDTGTVQLRALRAGELHGVRVFRCFHGSSDENERRTGSTEPGRARSTHSKNTLLLI